MSIRLTTSTVDRRVRAMIAAAAIGTTAVAAGLPASSLAQQAYTPFTPSPYTTQPTQPSPYDTYKPAPTQPAPSQPGPSQPGPPPPPDSGGNNKVATAPLCANANTPIARLGIAKAEQVIVCLTNRERQRRLPENRGLKPLAINATLMQTARAHSNDMVQNAFFDHVNKQGVDACGRIMAAGYSAKSCGENIAIRRTQPVTPYHFLYAPDGINGWMRSPRHKAQILNPNYSEIGVGLAAGDAEAGPGSVNSGSYTGTQNFGAR